MAILVAIHLVEATVFVSLVKFQLSDLVPRTQVLDLWEASLQNLDGPLLKPEDKDGSAGTGLAPCKAAVSFLWNASHLGLQTIKSHCQVSYNRLKSKTEDLGNLCQLVSREQRTLLSLGFLAH